MILSPGTGLRIAMVGFAILVALQLLIAASTAIVRGRDFGRLSRPVLLDQTLAAVSLLDSLAPAERITALRAINSPFIRFSVIEEFPQQELEGQPLPAFRPVLNAFRRVLPEGRAFRVYRRVPQSLSEHFLQQRSNTRRRFDTFIVVVRLADGAALAIEPSGVYRRHLAMNGLAFVAAVIGGICFIFLVWSAVATARPLIRMADAADRFAEDLKAPSMPEKGPRAVRNLARAFNRMQRKLQRLIAERTTTLAAVAHDFRTYLTRLRLRAEFIEDVTQREKAIHDIDEMSALVDDTLLFARDHGTTADRTRVALSDLLEDIVAGQTDLEREVVLSVAPEAEGVPVEANPTALKRALTNLIDNAVRYGDMAHVTLSREIGCLHITVRDRGPGVPEDQLARLTDPFFRVETSRSRGTGGAGLGLAITQRLIEDAGGTLSLRNGPEGGLEAWVSLPPSDDRVSGSQR